MYPSYVHYFPGDLRPIYGKRQQCFLEEREMEKILLYIRKTQVVAFYFHVMISALAGAPFYFYFFSPLFLFFFFFCFPVEGKAARGVLGGDLNIGIVFIFIKTFLLSIELLQ